VLYLTVIACRFHLICFAFQFGSCFALLFPLLVFKATIAVVVGPRELGVQAQLRPYFLPQRGPLLNQVFSILKPVRDFGLQQELLI